MIVCYLLNIFFVHLNNNASCNNFKLFTYIIDVIKTYVSNVNYYTKNVHKNWLNFYQVGEIKGPQIDSSSMGLKSRQLQHCARVMLHWYPHWQKMNILKVFYFFHIILKYKTLQISDISIGHHSSTHYII